MRKNKNYTYMTSIVYLLKTTFLYLLFLYFVVWVYAKNPVLMNTDAYMWLFYALIFGFLPIQAIVYGKRFYLLSKKIFIPSLIFGAFYGVIMVIEYIVSISISTDTLLFWYISACSLYPLMHTFVISLGMLIISANFTEIFGQINKGE